MDVPGITAKDIDVQVSGNVLTVSGKREEEKEVKKGGIIIPDTAKEKPQEGKVIAVGNGRVNEDGKKIRWHHALPVLWTILKMRLTRAG